MLRQRKESDGSAEEPPFATVIDAAGRRLLAAVNAAAAAAGLAPGMPLADALSFVPGLATAAAEPAKDAAALRRLAEWCGRYSPWTAPDTTDGVKIEITGCAHLWDGEADLAADLITRLAGQSISGRIAIADTLGAAWASARFAETVGSVVILPSAQTRAALAPLPVEGLRLDPATTAGLRRVGLKRIGDLYAMPRTALARRFGEIVQQRLDQAQGDLPEPLSPLGEIPARRVRLSFAEPIADPTDLALATERLVGDLVTRLAREGTGARRLVLAFHRIEGCVERVALGTARPTRDPHHLAALLKQRLDTIDPGLGVEDMILAAFAVDPLGPEQIGLPRPDASHLHGDPPLLVIPAKARIQKRPVPRSGTLSSRLRGGDELKPRDRTKNGPEGSISALLDRLGNRLSLTAVSRTEGRDSHIPERASVSVPATNPLSTHRGERERIHRVSDGEGEVGKALILRRPPPHPGPLPPQAGGEGASGASGLANKPPRPVRLFDPPEAIRATWLLPDDPPFRFTWRRRTHRVSRADGPERIAEEWWRWDVPEADPRAGGDAVRDYYRVEDEEGRRFWLFRAGLAGNGHSPRWYLHGIFA